MLHNKAVPTDNVLMKITGKELGQFFRAPIAWLFLVAFLMISLFVFFWVETFFVRNIADVRPLFEWMPLLLIFLSSALTMKMWSEERRSGTLEHVLTQPVALWQFVVGKFLACWALLGIALLMTLPLPITVSMLGDLDWGPVFSGYLAALLLGGAYLSMGLFVSARCDNQIVSLILSVALAGVFYLVGAGVLTSLVGNQAGELLRSLGTGSRFESITRGVVDFRDLYYYLSLMAAFIALNIFSLERGRWAQDGNRQHHSIWRWSISLVMLNVLFANVWLTKVPTLRWDTTRGDMYSISSATVNYLKQLQEPMLIRGYFSQKTHPLLAPLVPQVQDLLREYEVAGKGRINVEIVDPTQDPELEDQANNQFNIKPTPFRVNDRHQAAVVNSYFDILIQYGDEHEVLSFNDLIEVRMTSDTEVDVQLRNPEYDITRTIKKALYTYQSGGNIFESIKEPVTLTAYVSPNSILPKELVALRAAMDQELDEVKQKAGDKLIVKFVDPNADGGAEAKRIAEEYGFSPMVAGGAHSTPFYFYVVMGKGDQLLQIPLGNFSGQSFKSGLDAGIKRFSKGFTKTVALSVPKQMEEELRRHTRKKMKPVYDRLKQFLGNDFNVIDEDLNDASVDPSADILIVAGPDFDNEFQRFAVDQFVMRGGTVVMATSPYSATLGNTSITLDNYPNGIADWLEHMGISMENKVIMDPQNAAFPLPTVREVGGMRFQEMHLLDYPYFIDVRGAGLSTDSMITADLPQVTIPWASPIKIDETKTTGLKVTPLMYSSSGSWLSDDRRIMPSNRQVEYGYEPGENPQRHMIAVALEGKFTSMFAGKEAPTVELQGSASRPVNAVLNHSADTAKLIVFASTDMFRDEIIGMIGSATGGPYLNSLQLAANTVDWALEDAGLLTIRSRSHFNRTLVPMENNKQEFWEYLNYALALLSLVILWFITQYLNRVRTLRYQQWLAA